MIRIGIFLFFALLMASCTTITSLTPPQNIPWKDRQVLLNRLQSWQISGKVSIQSAQETETASLNWRESAHHYDLSLLGPFGSNGLRLVGQPGYVVLQMADGKRYSANNAEQLLAARSGYHLPVSNLRYWVRGLPAPGVAAVTDFDSYGRLSHLSQQGWDIQYLGYERMGKMDLPNKIFMSSSSLKVKLIIYSWNAH